MKPQGSSINKPGSKYSPAPVIYNRALFKMGATDFGCVRKKLCAPKIEQESMSIFC